jgi:hypothetical protein
MVIDLTLLVERIGRSSLSIAIVSHRDGLERLRARMAIAMMSLDPRKLVPMPPPLRGRSGVPAKDVRRSCSAIRHPGHCRPRCARSFASFHRSIVC